MTRRQFYELLFTFLSLLTIFISLSLFSYNSSDPSYTNIVFSRYEEVTTNIFGKTGAYTSDILAAFFGTPALFLPFYLLILLISLVRLYKQLIGPLRFSGIFIALNTILFSLSFSFGVMFSQDPFFESKPSGGLLGIFSNTLLKSLFGQQGVIIISFIIIALCVLYTLSIYPSDIITFLQRIVSFKKDETYSQQRQVKKEKIKDRKSSDEKKAVKIFITVLTLPAVIIRGGIGKIKALIFKSNDDKKLNTSNVNTSPSSNDNDRSIGLDNSLTADPLIEDDIQMVKHIPQELIPKAPDVADMILPPAPDIVMPILPDSYIQEDEIEPLTLQQSLAEKTSDEDLISVLQTQSELDIQGFIPHLKADSSLENRVTGANYHLSFDLLDTPTEDVVEQDNELLQSKADLLLRKLQDFGVDGRIRKIRPGPVVTMFEFEPAPGIKINKIANLESDLALAMSAISIRIIAPIPGKAAVGIEIPNPDRMMVLLKELLSCKEFKSNESPLAVALGKDISGKPYFSDLRKMPHLLVAGTTGSGKSVCVNTIICSILFKSSPDYVKFVMIDPKMVELSVYEGIPHLAAPVVTDPRKASAVLQNVVKEMEKRYSMLASCRVRSIDSYNAYIENNPGLSDENGELYTSMPYMVVIVDEFADLMLVSGKDVENSIIRIAQMARAVGIHLVLATQRPSVNVITGIIKANMPARISFRVSSKIDSRTIIDQNGAEILLGKGDSLFIPPGSSDPMRIHGCFVSEAEVLRIVDELKLYGEPDYDMTLLEDKSDSMDDIDGDDIDAKYGEAVDIAREKGFASISMIQRYLRIGYNRAARIVETMEKRGLIAPSDGTSKPREFIGKI